MKAFSAMFVSEFKLGMRQLDIPVFGIAFPILVAVILGLVYGRNNTAMIAQTFASVGTVGIAANGLMGLPLTLSGYRANKILKQLKVTPVSSSLILFVQFAVKLVLAVISTILVWLVMTVFFGYRMTGNVFLFALAYLLVAFATFGIGMIIASVSANVNTTNLLCSLVYFPMLFLSGATIPLTILPDVLVKILQVLPLTQGIHLLEAVSTGNLASQTLLPLVFMLVIGAASIIISAKTFKWE